MHSSTVFLGLTILSGPLAVAADQVVTMYIPDNADGPALAGKIIGSESDTTTYSITCADSISTTCEIPIGATIIEAPSTLTVLAAEAGQTGTVICTHDAKTATCSLGLDGEFLITSTDPVLSYEVTITATETGAASATPTTSSRSTTKGAEAQSTTVSNTTSGADAHETDEPDNGAMAGQPLGAAAMAVAMGVAVALL